MITDQAGWIRTLNGNHDEFNLVLFRQPIDYPGPNRYEVLSRLEANGQYIPAVEWIGDIVTNKELSVSLDWHVVSRVLSFAPQTNSQAWVNFSLATLSEPDFAETFLSVVQNSQWSPPELCIEVSEYNQLPFEPKTVKSNLRHLISNGFDVALDDLGKGASQLETLLHWPLTWFKLTGELSEYWVEPKYKNLVLALQEFAAASDLRLVVEWVETEAQRRFLEQFDVAMQGNAVGHPILWRSSANRFGNCVLSAHFDQ